MALLSCAHDWASESPEWRIMVVSFQGDYFAGSLGNNQADTMRQYLAKVIADTDAAAVLLDLTRLRYTWGDAIGNLVLPLRIGARAFRPFCVVAEEPTFAALAPLFGPDFLLA